MDVYCKEVNTLNLILIDLPFISIILTYINIKL